MLTPWQRPVLICCINKRDANGQLWEEGDGGDDDMVVVVIVVVDSPSGGRESTSDKLSSNSE